MAVEGARQTEGTKIAEREREEREKERKNERKTDGQMVERVGEREREAYRETERQRRAPKGAGSWERERESERQRSKMVTFCDITEPQQNLGSQAIDSMTHPHPKTLLPLLCELRKKPRQRAAYLWFPKTKQCKNILAKKLAPDPADNKQEQQKRACCSH